MYISGYAFGKDAQERSTARKTRYLALTKMNAEALAKDDRPIIEVKHTTRECNQDHYAGVVNDPTLSELDILLFCDFGNTCFGGTVERYETNFTAMVYTD